MGGDDMCLAPHPSRPGHHQLLGSSGEVKEATVEEAEGEDGARQGGGGAEEE